MRLGTFFVPDVNPDAAIDFARTIYEFPNHKVSRHGFLEKRKITKGGWPSQVVNGLKNYGLITEEGDMLKTTDLAEKLIRPKPSELKETKENLFNNIKLWKKLYDAGLRKEQVEKEDFWVYLSEIEGIKGVDREIIVKRTPIAQKSYIQALQYIETAEKPKVPPTLVGKEIGRGEIEMLEPIAPGLAEYRTGDIYIRVPKSREAIAEVRDVLTLWENRLKTGKKATTKEKEEI